MAVIKNPRKKKKAKAINSGLDVMTKDSLAANNQNVETVKNDDGSITVNFGEEADANEGLEPGSYTETQVSHYDNLVYQIDDFQCYQLGTNIVTNVKSDIRSMSDWLKTIEFGLDLMGVKLEEKGVPFEGACSAQHPLLMESAVKFQSKASNELLPANGPVRTKVLGDVTEEKELQANRVKAHMNYQIMEEMKEFYPDHERLLLYTALAGSGFVKTYYDKDLERPVSEFVPADQFIVPNSSPDLYRADRYTHILYKTEYELEAAFASGLYCKPEKGLAAPTTPNLSPVQKKTHELLGMQVGLSERDKVYTLYEQHIMLHIEGLDERQDGYRLASPYIITVEEASGKVLGIRRNWKENDPKRNKKVAFTHFTFVPSFHFYGFGFLHLLGNLQLTLTSALRSLVDAGQFATLQGGFKLKGVRITDDGSPIHPGQFKEIECAIMDVNKAIMPLPFKEPSSVLYQMLQFIDGKGQKFADSTEAIVQDSVNYGPVGTTMALLDASTKFFSAIHKRLHASLKNELQVIADINSETLPDDLEYNIENETMKIAREDYGPVVAVLPVSDPNISSNAHRMAKAQTLYQIAQSQPALHDMRAVLRDVYINMDYQNVDKLLPQPPQATPNDPMTDIQLASQGLPIRAFQGQDHKAHIALKQAFMQDPSSGANPMMQKVSLQLQANIQEHMILQFMEQVQANMGQQGQLAQGAIQGAQDNQDYLAAQGQTAPGLAAPAMSDPAQQAMAQAAQKVAAINAQNLQMQMAQGQMQDPKSQAALLLAHAEVQDTQTKARKQSFEEQYKQAELELKKAQMALDHIVQMGKLNSTDKKLAADHYNIITTKGIDAMIQGMSQSYQAKVNKDANMHKAQLAREAATQQEKMNQQMQGQQPPQQPIDNTQE